MSATRRTCPHCDGEGYEPTTGEEFLLDYFRSCSRCSGLGETEEPPGLLSELLDYPPDPDEWRDISENAALLKVWFQCRGEDPPTTLDEWRELLASPEQPEP